ncbi:hypothetical protein BJ546DRAFT_846579 [Cryomyces antarcticus]
MPTPRLFGGGSSTAGSGSAGQTPNHGKPRLQIIPDTRFIVFRGNEHQAGVARLTGRILLTSPESMNVRHLRITLEGKRQVKWHQTARADGYPEYSAPSEKMVFYTDTKSLLPACSSTLKLPAGVKEWHFEFELSGGMPESIEGLKDVYVIYSLRANLERSGYMSKDLSDVQHIRLVRTLGAEDLEATGSRINCDTWANKLSYNITLPRDTVIFGTSIASDLQFTPLRKGITIGKLHFELIEYMVLKIFGAVENSSTAKTFSTETTVMKHNMDVPEGAQVLLPPDENPDNPIMQDEMFKFTAHLPLPKSLKDVRQDVDTHRINITHKWVLKIDIHNPEGHVSQLVCRLPVRVWISPNLPVDEENNVVRTPNQISDEQLNSNEASQVPPPEYGAHGLDQLYHDMDMTGFSTPVPGRYTSGASTPLGLYAHSRNASAENLQSLDGMTAGLAAPNSHGEHAEILQSRLASLQEQGSSAQARLLNGHHSVSGGATPHSELIERDHHRHSQSDYDMDFISRIPSYSTAVAARPPETPASEIPPSYEIATSHPPSPVRSTIQRPGHAHVRSGTGMPGSVSSSQTITTANTSVSSTNPPPLAYRPGGDEERRLQMLRGRG